MNDKQLKAAIVNRLDAASQMGYLTDPYLSHLDGVLRGLIWAKTGEDPGTYISKDLARVCDLSGIAYRIDGETVIYAQKEEEVV